MVACLVWLPWAHEPGGAAWSVGDPWVVGIEGAACSDAPWEVACCVYEVWKVASEAAAQQVRDARHQGD